MKSAGTSTHVRTNNYSFFPDHTGMAEEETTPIWRYGKLEKKMKGHVILKTFEKHITRRASLER